MKELFDRICFKKCFYCGGKLKFSRAWNYIKGGYFYCNDKIAIEFNMCNCADFEQTHYHMFLINNCFLQNYLGIRQLVIFNNKILLTKNNTDYKNYYKDCYSFECDDNFMIDDSFLDKLKGMLIFE